MPWLEMNLAGELDQLEAGAPINPPDVLFAKIDEERVAELKARFGGSAAAVP
jgi:methionyl-tRNA synthetase